MRFTARLTPTLPTSDADAADGAAADAGTSDTPLASSVADQETPAQLGTARDGVPDDLTRIEGIGPSIERLLFDNGVFHFDQIAGWSTEQERWADDFTGFRGRAAREKWAELCTAVTNQATGAPA